MRRALMYLNQHGCEAVQHKGTNSLKKQIMHVLPVFELMSDSLTAIYVEPHWCPLQKSILLAKDQSVKFSWKFFENWRFWKTHFFLIGHFEFIFQDFFFSYSMKISPNLYGRKDGSRFLCFPWFPENSLLCVILRYTV